MTCRSLWTTVAAGVLALAFVVPGAVNAGFGDSVRSFLSGVFSAKSANTEAVLTQSAENAQNMALLKAALNPDPNPSKGGGDITIVAGQALLAEGGPSGALADVTVRPENDQISVYVVRDGDSLSQIAEMFNVSVNTIIWANDLKRGSLIQTGQTLAILPVSGVRHVVEEGDTLASIAKAYEGDAREISQYNGLAEDAGLAAGDEVIIPNGAMALPQAPSVTYSTPGNAPSYSGYYIHPVSGSTITQGLHGYNAVDFGAPNGTPVVAAAEGDVIISRSGGWNGGYGTYIVIRHGNGTQTLYAHNASNIVYVGQHVVKGQVIGYVGSTGRSTGPHVHFEVRGATNPFR